MANRDTPRGFEPVMDRNGRRYVGKGIKMYKGTEANMVIAIGDRVTVKASTDPKGLPEITRTAASAACTGVVVGIEIDPKDLYKKCYEAADVGYLFVETDPDILYRIQEDSDGGALTAADVKRGINPITSLDGDILTGISKLQLDSSTVGSGTVCRLERLDQMPDNAIGAKAKWLVSLALSTEINAGALNLTELA